MTINLQIDEALALGNQQTESDLVEEAAVRIRATSQAASCIYCRLAFS